MLDREKILKELRALNWPEEQFWVCSGAALVLHGVKKHTRDIDLGVATVLLERLIQQGAPCRLSALDGSRICQVGPEIEALENWGATSEKVVLEGIQVESLKSIRQQKERLGREKDWQDIRLIDSFLQAGDS